jgi:hypothetical protein
MEIEFFSNPVMRDGIAQRLIYKERWSWKRKKEESIHYAKKARYSQ